MPFSYVDPWPLIIFPATVTAFIMNLYTKLEGMLLKVGTVNGERGTENEDHFTASLFQER